jgi:hypothetical protein
VANVHYGRTDGGNQGNLGCSFAAERQKKEESREVEPEVGENKSVSSLSLSLSLSFFLSISLSPPLAATLNGVSAATAAAGLNFGVKENLGGLKTRRRRRRRRR